MQAFTYSPKQTLYPVDKRMRANKSIPRMQQFSGPDRGGNVTRTQLQQFTSLPCSRGCGNLDKLYNPVDSIVSLGKRQVYGWCSQCVMKHESCEHMPMGSLLSFVFPPEVRMENSYSCVYCIVTTLILLIL